MPTEIGFAMVESDSERIAELELKVGLLQESLYRGVGIAFKTIKHFKSFAKSTI